ncbi:MAG: hypothetical protein PHF18_06575 [Methanosarcina sp.]|uniref:hypothetical protein n=1 Tax=Methanosarcina sp. TaxID=2213 RepID=UPI0026094E55|nr:hypothetical protein [Methanosarcina sp.]MDD3246502.1 hypothetical protein [Methanosarcina sp.]
MEISKVGKQEKKGRLREGQTERRATERRATKRRADRRLKKFKGAGSFSDAVPPYCIF